MLNNIFLINSPLDQFEVTSLLGLNAPILGLNLTLTNFGLYSMIVLLLVLVFHFAGNNENKLIPSK
jgi:F-type H+-transporting ATPase subunit a